MRPISVFRLQMGEDCEGAHRTMLFYIWEDAVAEAEKWIADSTFDWEVVESRSSQDECSMSWHGGCDWIELREVDVH